MFESTKQITPSDPPKNSLVAALLSLFLLGGVGQLYLGQEKKGIILIVVWLIGICTGGVVSVAVQIVGAIDAYQMAEKLAQGEAVGDMQWFWEI